MRALSGRICGTQVGDRHQQGLLRLQLMRQCVVTDLQAPCIQVDVLRLEQVLTHHINGLHLWHGKVGEQEGQTTQLSVLYMLLT